MGAGVLFSLEPFTMLLVGMLVGLVFGALPGFSSGNTSALMLPLTLGMSNAGAIIFICGIYCGAQYGGGIPSILIGVPGTTGAIATVFDGYPMAQQGKSDQALGLSLQSSTFGGIVASVIAIFLIRPIAGIALAFGPAEMALLAVVGLAIIASIVGENIRKGLLATVVGLLMGTMSADPALGLSRLNFGFLELYDSLPLTPIIMGLFAFPTVIELINGGSFGNKKAREVGTKVMEGVWAGCRRPLANLRAALIGLFVGIVPGAGIDIGSFMAYSLEKSLSKSPETFGKGNPDGVVASEGANNGVTAGALVPAISLGVPGGTTTAVMLTAMTLHGVQTGPQVLRNFPGDAYAVMLACLVCSILTFPMGYLFNKVSVKVLMVKVGYLIPGVFGLCIIGSYAIRGFGIDMYLCLIAGLIGIAMKLGDYPLPPLILGFILAPIAEQNFVRAILLSKGNLGIFVASPISKVMWAVILVTFLLPIVIHLVRSIQGRRAAGA
ncbi:MAG: tripartite tricarboxylate transporter permease [candidate division NC10 bacterium]|nr:tripartite tricarboxylate transporter permease [candidate division NC10 bacterium]